MGKEMKKISSDVRKLATLSLLIAVAMILSYVESLIPPLAAVPGVKMGLSNIATVFALYTLGIPSAVTVSLVRVCLSALLFGNITAFIYSLSGATLALCLMILFYKLGSFSSVGVSIIGAVSHNAGQVIAVSIVMENAAIAYYIAPLLISGTVAGALIGIAAGVLVERTKKYIFK